MIGREINLGSTVVALERLENRALVETWMSGRKCYTITITAERALAHAKELPIAVSDFLADFA